MDMERVYIGRERIPKWDKFSGQMEAEFVGLNIYRDMICSKLVNCSKWRIYYNERVVLIDGVKVPFEFSSARYYHYDGKRGYMYYLNKEKARIGAQEIFGKYVNECKDEFGDICFVRARTYKFYVKENGKANLLREFLTLEEARMAARKVNQESVTIFYRNNYGEHHEIVYPYQYQ